MSNLNDLEYEFYERALDGTLPPVTGGDYEGPTGSTTHEIHTFADTSGKVGSSAADVQLEAGLFSRITPDADLTLSPKGVGKINVGNARFINGDVLNYPTTDGTVSDTLVTDGAGNLQFLPDTYEVITTDATMGYGSKRAYIDASANPVTVTLGDSPRLGEKKTLWVGNQDNLITVESANPSFPIQTPPQIGEGNIQGQWTLSSDFLDRYSPTSRDLTLQGTGGAFVNGTVNGEVVSTYDFQGSSYLTATASDYRGVTGTAPRSFTCWYAANAGTPTGDETLVAWGEDIPPGGLLWEIDFRMSQGYLWVNNRNASRRWNTATLEAVNLFDGNYHHIAVTQPTSNMGSISLYIDGVIIPPDFQDTFPNCTTSANTVYRIGANYNGGTRLNARLYDVRLFDRGLTSLEVTEIRNESLLGGVVVSVADPDTVFDVVYNGAEWVLGVGTDAVALTNRANITGLEDRVVDLEGKVGNIVEFDMTRLANYSVPAGVDQTINYSSVFRYLIDGQVATPVITNGVWTVDIPGTYLVTTEGWLDRATGTYDTDYVRLHVSRNGQNYTQTNPDATVNQIVTVGRHLGSVQAAASMELNAGDTVEIKTGNIGATAPWDLNDFVWKATLMHP